MKIIKMIKSSKKKEKKLVIMKKNIDDFIIVFFFWFFWFFPMTFLGHYIYLATLLKKTDSGVWIFLRIMWNFTEQLFCRIASQLVFQCATVSFSVLYYF